MNIREAKQEIKHTLLAYHQKDDRGRYLYPPVLVSIRTIAPVLIFVILISYFLWQ